MVFKPQHSWEFCSADDIEARTIRALRNQVAHVREDSPHYAVALAHVDPRDIDSLESFSRLPLTEKNELAASAASFTAVPPESVAEIVVTSGSTGKPLLFPLTANDLDRLAFNEALSFNAAGIDCSDRVQILVSLDRLFIAGMAYYRGLTLLGATTARVGVLPFPMQKHYLELLKPTALVGVPSFLLKLAAELERSGFDPATAGIRTLVCIGETVRTRELELNPVGQALTTRFGATVCSTYGATELSVAYGECTHGCGGHSHPELVYTEIVDDEGHTLPDGEIGELVTTTLGVEGVPLVRYRTGDMTFAMTAPCACGRNSCRIGPILGRKSQLIKLKGTTLYPTTVTNALDGIDGIEDYVLVLENDTSLSDRVTLHAATRPDNVPLIAQNLRTHARVAIPVLVSNIPTITALRGEQRKKVRIVDRRLRLTPR